MGVRFSRASILQDWEGRLHEIPSAIALVDTDLAAIASEGKDEMQSYIASRGTAYSRSQGRSGRQESNTMYDDVSFRKNPFPSNLVFSWEFGWVGAFERYFGLQEKGFRHVGGTSVEPMYALRDAATTAKEKMVALGPIILRKLAALVAGKR